MHCRSLAGFSALVFFTAIALAPAQTGAPVRQAPASAPVRPAPAAAAVDDATAGEAALNRNDYNTAIEMFTRAIASGGLSPADAETAYVERARAYIGLGNDAAAQSDLNQAQRLNPNDPDIATLQARIQAPAAQAAAAQQRQQAKAGEAAAQKARDAAALDLQNKIATLEAQYANVKEYDDKDCSFDADDAIAAIFTLGLSAIVSADETDKCNEKAGIARRIRLQIEDYRSKLNNLQSSPDK